jgi:Homeobox KN domain
VQETGLQLKQINNWFINQRKRNWHSNPSSSSAVKSKRKRYFLLFISLPTSICIDNIILTELLMKVV